MAIAPWSGSAATWAMISVPFVFGWIRNSTLPILLTQKALLCLIRRAPTSNQLPVQRIEAKPEEAQPLLLCAHRAAAAAANAGLSQAGWGPAL